MREVGRGGKEEKTKTGGGRSQDIFLTQKGEKEINEEEINVENMSSQNGQIIEEGEGENKEEEDSKTEEKETELESQSLLLNNSEGSQESSTTGESDSARSSTPKEGKEMKDFSPDVSRESTTSMKLRNRELLRKPDKNPGQATESQVEKAIQSSSSECS